MTRFLVSIINSCCRKTAAAALSWCSTSLARKTGIVWGQAISPVFYTTRKVDMLDMDKTEPQALGNQMAYQNKVHSGVLVVERVESIRN
jgi:hypothetical protein